MPTIIRQRKDIIDRRPIKSDSPVSRNECLLFENNNNKEFCFCFKEISWLSMEINCYIRSKR